MSEPRWTFMAQLTTHELISEDGETVREKEDAWLITSGSTILLKPDGSTQEVAERNCVIRKEFIVWFRLYRTAPETTTEQ